MKVLIVGAGFSGATVAWRCVSRGDQVTVIDRRSHVAGNAFTEVIDNQLVHVYGPHIFHTNDKGVWDFVNQFATFDRYTHQAKAIGNDGELYSLPFSMETFHQVFNATTAEEARFLIADDSAKYQHLKADNVTDWCLKNIGPTLYYLLVRYYTSKMWGKDPDYLPASLIKRLPLRFSFNTDYFNDVYEGVPQGGYTKLIEKMLVGADIRLNTEFTESMANDYDSVVFTGALDVLCGHELGKLETRALRFERYVSAESQGCTQLNDCRETSPWTRTSEPWLFERNKQRPEKIWHVREFPDDNAEPAYPVNDAANSALHQKYIKQVKWRYPTMKIVGRMATHRYLNMDQAIAQALALDV